jgi:hypothetical protein
MDLGTKAGTQIQNFESSVVEDVLSPSSNTQGNSRRVRRILPALKIVKNALAQIQQVLDSQEYSPRKFFIKLVETLEARVAMKSPALIYLLNQIKNRIRLINEMNHLCMAGHLQLGTLCVNRNTNISYTNQLSCNPQ